MLQQTFLLAIIAAPNFAFAQNLVPNYSFELWTDTPSAIKRIGSTETFDERVAPWYAAENNPDLIDDRIPYIPVNEKDARFALQKAAEGNCMAGIGFNKNSGWRERIEVRLDAPLIAGENYHISYQASYLNDFGLNEGTTLDKSFLSLKLAENKKPVDVRVKPDPTKKPIIFMADRSFKEGEWVTLEYDFVPTTLINYLSIGFWGTSVADIKHNEYFFIDDVHVEKTAPKPSLERIKKGETLVLDNIYFESGKSSLLNTSFAELDKLVAMLQKRPELRIAIIGHTDNNGAAAANLSLSSSRAKAVSSYLQGKGIAPQRLESKGLGQTKPIAPNTTDDGRAKNRRVEVQVL